VAQPKKTGKATVGLNYIQSLYAIEKKGKSLTSEERKRVVNPTYQILSIIA